MEKKLFRYLWNNVTFTYDECKKSIQKDAGKDIYRMFTEAFVKYYREEIFLLEDLNDKKIALHTPDKKTFDECVDLLYENDLGFNEKRGRIEYDKRYNCISISNYSASYAEFENYVKKGYKIITLEDLILIRNR